MFLLSTLAILMVLVAAAVVTLALPLFTRGAPHYPTRMDRVKTAIELAAILPGEKVVDLGSGDGRLVRSAAAAGADAVGYEINPYLVWQSRRQGTPTLWANFWRADLSEVDVVFLFFLPQHLATLEAKLASELKAGARVVSIAFPLPTWQPETSTNGVYLYRRKG